MITKSISRNDSLFVTITDKEAGLSNSDAFKKELMSYIDQGHSKIVVDFVNVEFLDSSFLGAMVSSLKYAISKQSDISVTNLGPDIQHLFSLTRMDKVFKIHSPLAVEVND